MVEKERSPRTAQLKEQVDRGVSADKVNFPDPAAAPLGTDDEAAGNPAGPGRVAASMRAEDRAGRTASDKGRPRQGERHVAGPVRIIAITVIVLAIIGGLLVVAFARG